MIDKIKKYILGNIINIVIGIITIPITVRLLSPEQYGKATFYETILNLISLFSFLGIDQGFMRYYYEEKEECRGNLFLKCLLLTLCSFFVIYLLIGIFFRERIIFNNEVYYLLFFGCLSYIVNRFVILVIRMKQHMQLYSVIIIINQILKFILILILYNKYGNNYQIIIFSIIFTNFISILLGMYFERESWKSSQKMKVGINEIVEYSFPMCFSVLAMWVFQSSDKIMLKYFSTDYQLGIYSASFKLVAILNLIQQAFTTFWIPFAYEKHSKDKENLKFFKNFFENIQILIFIGIMLVFFTKDIIVYFLGENYIETKKVFPFLIFIPTMYILSEITVLGLIFKKKSKVNMGLTVGVSILNILLNFIFINKIGARGAAISSGLTYIAFFYLRTFFSYKISKLKFSLKKVNFGVIITIIYALELTFYDRTDLNLFIGILGSVILIQISKKNLKKMGIKGYLYYKKLKKISS